MGLAVVAFCALLAVPAIARAQAAAPPVPPMDVHALKTFSGHRSDYERRRPGVRITGQGTRHSVPAVGARINEYDPGIPERRPSSEAGARKWIFKMNAVSMSGVLTTASDLLFTGGREGYFQALDARTGALLWNANLGGEIASGPMSYQIDGKQYIAIASGNVLFVFGLRD